MFNSVRNRFSNSNTLVGLFLLVVLAVFAGPNALPRLIGQVFDDFDADEGVPCAWLRPADERDQHQSLIARAAAQEEPPVSIRVSASAFPTLPEEELVVRIVLNNESVGTVPIIVPPNILTTDNGASGIGVLFNSTAPVNLSAGQPVPEDQIRLLGPRQTCVQKIRYSYTSLTSSGISPNSIVKAYYRSNSQGTVPASEESIYQDAGLWVGVVESPAISLAVSDNVDGGAGIGLEP